MSETYDRDFYAWANEQASLLRAGRLAEADIAHIAEEIESMGKTEKRELVSRLTVLLLHLLKWRFQADRAGDSWRLSIANSRDQIEDHLEDNSSLKSELPRTISQAYRYARRDAARETDLRESIFPTTCPWTFEQMMDPDFWPGEAGS